SRGRSATSRVPSCVPFLLLLECRFQCCERALAGFAGALVLERCLDLLAAPAACCLGELCDRHRRVALRERRLGLFRRRGGCGGFRLRHFGLRLGGRPGRGSSRAVFWPGTGGFAGGASSLGALRGADRLDLDPGQPAAVAGVLLVARAAAVLADADLLAELVADDARGDGRGRREIRRAVAADQQDARLNSRTLGGAQAVDEQPLALSDAVLLAAQTDDRVGAHGVETRALRPRQGSVANGSCRARRPTPTSGRTRSRRSWAAAPAPLEVALTSRSPRRHSSQRLQASSYGSSRRGSRAGSSSWLHAASAKPPAHRRAHPRPLKALARPA